MASLTPERAAQARAAVLQVQQEGRAQLASRARGGPSDGFEAALDLPPEAVLPAVADGIAACLPPRTAAIRALDAWIKARRAAINSAARAEAAERLAERLRAAADAVRRGDSVQDWTAVQPFVQAGDVVLSVVHRGGAVDVVALDGAPVHALSEPAERSALVDLAAAVRSLYRQTTDDACRSFRPARRTGAPGAVLLEDRRGRCARGYVDEAGELRVYEVDGLPVDPDAPAVQAMATGLPSGPAPIRG